MIQRNMSAGFKFFKRNQEHESNIFNKMQQLSLYKRIHLHLFVLK